MLARGNCRATLNSINQRTIAVTYSFHLVDSTTVMVKVQNEQSLVQELHRQSTAGYIALAVSRFCRSTRKWTPRA
jgi:hypothetical protein